jgi:hypothetical protein
VDIGNQIKVKVILVSGIMDKYQDMEFIQWKVDKNIKVNLLIFWNMDMGDKYSQMEIYMKDDLSMVNP